MRGGGPRRLFGGIKGKHRCEGAAWVTLKARAALLSDAAAVFDRRLDEMIDRGTHSIVIGSVEAVRTRDAGQALIYWRSAYRPLDA
ncbi:flavin reductase family protein [Mesorhizobium intechi]|uniref:flavin reductase family protein n=1 Tax=Mesorhizobium intechi TaxID=537601 RepID=UPI001FE84995|nr:flavin reductase family protein [Mesorhizobium intechi]